MASMFDILDPSKKQKKAPPSLGQLTDTAGMPVDPTSPQSAAAAGGNPDQAKMAGTAQQVEPALQKAIQKPTAAQDQYATAVRQEQARGTATAAEEAIKAEAKKSQEQFGTLGTGVAAAMRNLTTTQPQVNEAGGLIETQLRAAGKSSEEIAAANSAYTAWQKDQTPENLDKAYFAVTGKHLPAGADAAKTAAAEFSRTYAQKTPEALAGMIPDNITVADLTKAVGSDGKPFLTLTPEQMKELGLTEKSSLKDAQAAINAKLGPQFSDAKKLQDQLNDPNLSAADRNEIRKQLADMGATGVRASEVEIKGLMKSIDEADMITFNGKQMSVADALADSNISNAITEFLQMTDKQREASPLDPGLKKWITDNEGTLKAVATEFADQSGALGQVRADYQAQVLNPPPSGSGGPMDSDLWKKFLTEQGLPTDTGSVFKAPDKLPPVIAAALDKTTGPNAAGNLVSLSTAGIPSTALNGLTPEDLKAIGFTGNTDADKLAFGKVTSFLTTKKAIDEGTADPVEAFFGSEGAMHSAVATVIKNHEIAALRGGTDPTASLYSILSRNGVLDDRDLTSAELKDIIKTIPLKDMATLTNTTSPGNLRPSTRVADPLRISGPVTPQSIAAALDSAPTTLTRDELINAYGSGMSGAIDKFVDRKTQAELDKMPMMNDTSKIPPPQAWADSAKTVAQVEGLRNVAGDYFRTWMDQLKQMRDSGQYSSAVLDKREGEVRSWINGFNGLLNGRSNFLRYGSSSKPVTDVRNIG